MMIDLAQTIVLRPREAIARLLAMRLPMDVRWQLFAVVVILSTLESWVFVLTLDRNGIFATAAPTPVTLGLALALLMLLSVAAAYAIGRGFGGTGRFSDCLLAFTALQGVMVAFQLLQFTLLLVSTPLAEVVGIASFLLFFWVMANFIMELHGFRSLARVALGVFLTLTGVSFMLFNLAGLSVMGG